MPTGLCCAAGHATKSDRVGAGSGIAASVRRAYRAARGCRNRWALTGRTVAIEALTSSPAGAQLERHGSSR